MNDQPRRAPRRKAKPSLSLGEIGIEDKDLRVEIFTLCEGAIEQEGRLSMIGTYETVNADGFPFVIPQVTVVLRLRFWPAEHRNHLMSLTLTGPDGLPVGSPVEVPLTLLQPPQERSNSYNVITRFHNLQIVEPGEYAFDFRLNGRCEGRLPMCVSTPPSASFP